MNRLLYRGCSPGEDVKILQNDLNAVRALPSQKSAFDPLDADGVFGAKTQGRVQEFQSLNGLAADGVVGPKSRGTLSELLGEVPGAQAAATTGGAAPGGGKGYSGGPPFGKPAPASIGGKETGYGGKSTGSAWSKGLGGKATGPGGGGGSGSGGGKTW